VLIWAKVTNQQDLPAFFNAVCLALAIAILHARFVTATETVSLPMQPGEPMLGAQAGQAMAEQASGQALEQGHFGNRSQFWGQIRLVLRHADSCDELGYDKRTMVAGIDVQFQPIALLSCS
jgi:hypothetical protein